VDSPALMGDIVAEEQKRSFHRFFGHQRVAPYPPVVLTAGSTTFRGTTPD
jgi:hypothetical protein